jgi:TolA-binding protein
LAVALALALTLVGLTGPVAAQADDHNDTQDDLEESIEQLETSADEQQERHNTTHSMEQLDTSDDERALEDAIERLESDG